MERTITNTVTINEQECNDTAYDYNIQMVVTPTLLQALAELGGLSPNQILFIAHTILLEKYGNRNIDGLQVFVYKGLTFWAISNKTKDEEYHPEYHCVTWLLPSDY